LPPINAQEDTVQMHVAANTGVHTKFRLFLSDFNQSNVSQPPVIEHPKIKFHTNAIKDSRIVTSEETDGQTW
jgi:hypothetical protein